VKEERMPRVLFTEDYTFVPEDRRTAVKYKAGWTGPVRQLCADKAIAAGKAMPVKTLGRARAAK
jgi:hypothetical protein